VLLLGGQAAFAAPPPTPARLLALVEQAGGGDEAVRKSAAEALLATGDRRLLGPLVDQLFFTPPRHRAELQRVLAGLAGGQAGSGRYFDWVERVSREDTTAPLPGYVGWKGRLFARIDPRFGELLRDDAAVRLRVQEIVSGGVRFDGIPALERPAHLSAATSALAADELVFGARVGGAARAWPVRVLSWHEMLNDEVGGEPVTLSYCTLCRSAILYLGRLPDGRPTTFGTSGLLYRSNKLMFDRATRTLWSNLTGEALLGPLAVDAAALSQLPLTLTTWAAWRRDNPDTTAMVVDPELARRHGYDYSPGAADVRRAGVAFPVPRRDSRLPDREEVYGVSLGGAAKAWALAPLLAAGVVEDRVGELPIVLVAEPETGAVRAYGGVPAALSGLAASANGELRDRLGRRWVADETRLAPHDGEPGEALPRLPAHRAYWFGWVAFHPATAVWP
jgi:hypothetical protein